MITCRRVAQLHTEADEEALSRWDRFRYRFHMSICPGCKVDRRGLEATREALRDVPPEAAPPAVKAAALEALRRARRSDDSR